MIRTSRSTWQLYVVFVHPAVELLRGICLELCNPQCCIRFPGSSVHRFVFSKMILLLVCVDLVITLRICSENNTWCCAFSLVKLFFSFHAYHFLDELCRHCVIEDDRIGPCLFKIAVLLLERAIHCTNTPCLEVVSKYSCMARFLLLINRKRSPSSLVFHPSDPPQ